MRQAPCAAGRSLEAVFDSGRTALEGSAGRALSELRQTLEARVSRSSQDSACYVDLSRLHARAGQQELAVEVLMKGLASCPPNESLYAAAVFELAQGNRTEDAISLARRAIRLFPEEQFFQLRELLLLPVLYRTPEEIRRYRERFSEALERLDSELELATLKDRSAALAAVGRHVNFYLGYQGLNDTSVQRRYGNYVHRILAAAYPQWTRPRQMPRASGRIRIGYISAHFRNHSVAKLFLGWLKEHNRKDFELFSYHNGETADRVTEEVREISDHFRHMPGDVEPLCEAICADDLHIAVFLDVRHKGMAMVSSLRLAPVQCLAWACPITSGSPNMDYYLSGAAMEPEDGAQHYTEELVRLPGIGVCYPKPVIPRPLLRKTRHDFGLGDNRVVYLCCQSIFKYLPQHDHLFAEIAKRTPVAQFVFLTMNSMVGGDLESRLWPVFAAEGLDAEDYCVVLPQLNTFDYWNLNVLADVFLDSLEWSGGVTTLEAIACGLPVVTLPGRFMRGRHSFGILSQLGVTDTVARDKTEYVDLAVRLGHDRAWRARLVQQMGGNVSRLFSERSCVAALEDFYRDTVAGRV